MVSKLRKLWRDESGITALETAIILIAFVVVASVFAFTILSAGTSSTEKSKDAIYSGLEQVEGSMQVVGSVIAGSNAVKTHVKTITFTLASAGGGAGIDMTPNVSPTVGQNKVVIDYQDASLYKTNIQWSTSWIVRETSQPDELLEQDEQVLIIINVNGQVGAEALGTDQDFAILVKPPSGGVIPIERRTPSDLTTIMDLH